jgi:hypothetical protein
LAMWCTVLYVPGLYVVYTWAICGLLYLDYVVYCTWAMLCTVLGIYGVLYLGMWCNVPSLCGVLYLYLGYVVYCTWAMGVQYLDYVVYCTLAIWGTVHWLCGVLYLGYMWYTVSWLCGVLYLDYVMYLTLAMWCTLS